MSPVASFWLSLGREFDPAAHGTGAARPRTFATWKAEVVNVDLRSTLWLFNIAMENGPFIDGLPINSMVIFHSYVK